MSNEVEAGSGVLLGTIISWMIFGLIAGGCYGVPKYNVWRAGQHGEAALRRSEQEKLILVEQAKAELESAEVRAKAIEFVGKAAQQYPEYRYQEFLGAFADALRDGKIQQIIYVPTEANIPLMEAGKR